MGQKIHPIAFRLGKFYTGDSRWFVSRHAEYAKLILEDFKLREELMKRLRPAGITKVEIERSLGTMKIVLHVARPGVVIGRGGTGLEDLKKYVLEKILKLKADDKAAVKIDLRVEPVKEPNLAAQVVAQNIVDQLLKRIPAKRVMNGAIEKVMSAGARGVRVQLGGRVNGAEISRIEHIQAGVLPLATMREKIDYAEIPAKTRSGYIGVKVWICLK